MAAFHNQIIGLVRFSYPALGGFAHKIGDRAALEGMLFDPARLKRRFALFEALCLPALLAQDDSDFTCLFLIGENLPPWARARLADGVCGLRDARIIAAPPRHHYAQMKASFAQVPQDGFSHRTTFRLDDDDALDLGYIARLRAVARRLKPLCSSAAPVAIAFNRGFYVALDDTGGQDLFDACERTPLSVGTALLAPAGHADNIYARNHRFLPQFFNTWSDATTPTYLRAIHRDNDSTPTIIGRSRTMAPAEVAAEVRARFPASVQAFLGL